MKHSHIFLKYAIHRWLLIGVLMLVPRSALGTSEPQRIDLEVGSSTVLRHRGITRIAIGNSQIVQATVVNSREIIVFGKAKGSTTLDLWSSVHQRQSYKIMVAPEGLGRIQEELNRLLKNIPQAHSRLAGDKLVIEGDDLTDADQLRIANLAKRYPEVIDFTSQLGWDKMILLDVQVIELPSARMQELGVRWDPAAKGGMHAGLAWEGHSGALAQRPAESALSVPFPAAVGAGYAGLNALLSARLAALSKTGEAVILAQPQLLARSGATAAFMAGGEVPYATTDKDGKSTTTFKKYGVSLTITPRAERNSAIRSKIDIEVSSVDPTINVPGGPALKIRKASTEFNVRSGQTLVLGGFIARERSSDQDGLPGVSTLPLVGRLFGVAREQERHTELAIFVTPIIVDPQDAGLLARVSKAQALIDQSFPGSPKINSTLRATSAGDQWESHAPLTEPRGLQSSQWEESPGPAAITVIEP